ncbi:MAG: hypothetical protein HPY46_08190 [Candidatus Aminicenantes bacterium]|nr:hypothetical protein [Candidatus Aminicenantes bacterium]
MASRIISLFPDHEAGQEFQVKGPRVLGRLIERLVSSFGGNIIISVVSHTLLISLFLSLNFFEPGFKGLSFGNSADPSRIKENLVAFNLALNDLGRDEKYQEILSGVLSKIEQTEVTNITDDFIWVDTKLSQKERVEFFKQLIKRTLLDQTEYQTTWYANQTTGEISSRTPDTIKLNSGKKIFLKPSMVEESKYEVFILDKEVSRALDRMKGAGLIKEKPASMDRGTVQLSLNGAKVEIPAEYYYRSSPYELIMARGAKLFSIVRGFSHPRPFGDTQNSTWASKKIDREDKPTELVERGYFKVFYYGEIDPVENRPEENIRPLTKRFTLPREKWQELLDGLMAYDEEEQFRRLEKEFLQDCDPNDAHLAEFVKEFINLNLNGAILLHQPFQAAFDSLEELYYKSPIFERLLFYVNKSPESLVATEFLFCLASALDFERRTIDYLHQSYLEASVCLERKINVDYVFNSKAKALTIKTVFDELTKILSASNFSSVEDALNRYTKEIIKIYDYLVEKGGETADRARYALGCLLWERGQKKEAVSVWQKISPVFKVQPFPRIRGILYGPKFSLVEESVSKVLDFEARRYTYLLNERAVRFHKWSRREGSQQK